MILAELHDYTADLYNLYMLNMYKVKSVQQRERVSRDLFLCSNDTLFIIASTTSLCVYVIGLNIVLFILIFLQNEYLANEKGIPQQCHSMKWLFR